MESIKLGDVVDFDSIPQISADDSSTGGSVTIVFSILEVGNVSDQSDFPPTSDDNTYFNFSSRGSS
jgi:hypothetical protein